VPPLRLSWTRTVPPGSRLLAHVIVCVVPIVQLAPATGAVTAIPALEMANVALVPLAGTAPFDDTRTTAADVAGPAAVHARFPVAAALAASVE
jgi:hypothetical protein